MEVFGKVEANPLKSTAMEGAEFARSHKCDFVVALGGGSVMDAAKIMAMMAKIKATFGTMSLEAPGRDFRYPTPLCLLFALPPQRELVQR